MGHILSCCAIDQVVYLLGDISALSPLEKKFFSLGRAVLDKYDKKSGMERKRLKYCTMEEELDLSFKQEVNEDCVPLIDCSLFIALPVKKKLFLTQTYTQWKSLQGYQNLFSCCQPPKRTIYIQPIDRFPDFIENFEVSLGKDTKSFDLFNLICKFISIFYDGMNVVLLPQFNLSDKNWNISSRIHEKTGKLQYLVSDFHPNLKRVMPADGYGIMGLVWTDLYPSAKLNFVLGEALTSTQTGIFCFGRFEPKVYDPDKHQDIRCVDSKLLWRLFKVCSHELGHLFGMTHCHLFQCAMNESSSMEEALSQPLFLCPVCLRKIHSVCAFDLIDRYRKLRTFLSAITESYDSEEFEKAIKWLDTCIGFLKEESI